MLLGIYTALYVYASARCKDMGVTGMKLMHAY